MNSEIVNGPVDTSVMLGVGELAGRAGLATSALRFYEEEGLLHPERNEAGHRRYSRPLVGRVAFIVFAQRVGFTLGEVRTELDKLSAERVPTSTDWDRLTETWTKRINERIEELRRLKLGLTGCIGCGRLSLESCGILNPNDRAADNGAGPRYWIGDERSGRSTKTKTSRPDLLPGRDKPGHQ